VGVTFPCPFCNAAIDAAGTHCPYCGGALGVVLAPGEWVARRFEVLDCLGAGPLGATYRVRDAGNGVTLALKAISDELCPAPADRAAFVSQLEMFAGRTIAGCAMPLKVGADERIAYFTVPLIDGVSLRAALSARAAVCQPFTHEEALRVMSALSAATSALHSATPHGALRPENVVVTARGLILTDCAVAVALPPDRLQLRLQSFARAVPFVAPEVAAGKKITATADLFALGAIASEILAGSPSHRALDHAGLPPEVETPLRALLDRDRAKRPGALGALLDALGRACGYERRPADAPLPVPENPTATTASTAPPRVRASVPSIPAVRPPPARAEAPATVVTRAATRPASMPEPPSTPPPVRPSMPAVPTARPAVPTARPAVPMPSAAEPRASAPAVPPLSRPGTPPSVPPRAPISASPSAPEANRTAPPAVSQLSRTGLPSAAVCTAPVAGAIPPLPTGAPAPPARTPRLPAIPGMPQPAGKHGVLERRPAVPMPSSRPRPSAPPEPKRSRDLDGIDPRLLRAAKRLEADRKRDEPEDLDTGEIEVLDE
jgi:serine/threonine protein kinase